MKQKVIFICTGNSCRSQMAEGMLRAFAADRYEVSSAGLEPGTVNPRAVRAMNEIGIDISGHTSDDVDQFVNDEFDFIITVCDNASERCPFFPGEGTRKHWSFIDPADATGTEDEIMDVFRKVRDQIRLKIEEFLSNTDIDT
jgi:arsenate reductase